MELTPDQMRLLAQAAHESGADSDTPAAMPASVTTPPPAPAAEQPPRAARNLRVAANPEVVITVDIGPAVVRHLSPAPISANARAPIVIEHTPAPVKPRPIKQVQPPSPPPAPAAAPVAVLQQPRRMNSHLRGALIASVMAIAAFMSTIAYVAVTKARPSTMPVFTAPPPMPRETAPVPPPPVVAPLPMRFANPFDASEVFEFPPGTTEMEARDAVASLLLERAESRLTPADRAQLRSGRSANPHVRHAATKLASRN